MTINATHLILNDFLPKKNRLIDDRIFWRESIRGRQPKVHLNIFFRKKVVKFEMCCINTHLTVNLLMSNKVCLSLQGFVHACYMI